MSSARQIASQEDSKTLVHDNSKCHRCGRTCISLNNEGNSNIYYHCNCVHNVTEIELVEVPVDSSN